MQRGGTYCGHERAARNFQARQTSSWGALKKRRTLVCGVSSGFASQDRWMDGWMDLPVPRERAEEVTETPETATPAAAAVVVVVVERNIGESVEGRDGGTAVEGELDLRHGGCERGGGGCLRVVRVCGCVGGGWFEGWIYLLPTVVLVSSRALNGIDIFLQL